METTVQTVHGAGGLGGLWPGSREQTGLLTTCRDPLCTAPGCERRALDPSPYRLLL